MAARTVVLDPDLTPSPEQVFQLALAREVGLSRLLVAYIGTGLAFMLLPGTFLGVWNLLSISAAHATGSVAPAWIQAHGHAQVFGWIGSFILGIGFYSIPKLLRARAFALWRGWVCWAAWTTGVALRWIGNVYGWHWRVLLPVSAVLEFGAFLLFFAAVAGHRAPGQDRLAPWIWSVIAGAMGLMLALAANAVGCLWLALRGGSPAFSPAFDQRFLVLMAWGFMVPFVWGFSARWMLIFLGLRPLRGRALVGAAGINAAGVLAALAGWIRLAAVLLIVAAAVAVVALRMFEASAQPAKTRGVHASYPYFVRAAYLWLLIAAGLGIWAATAGGDAAGLWGASRHALTVGFIATMVFSVGQRVLPAFSGMRHLYSSRLMFASLVVLMAGCALRVTSEALAYQGVLATAWSWLPVSAITEMTGVTLFAVNMIASFAQPAPPVACG
jgi:uncharacterized protein involved in response to NO